MTLGPPPDSDSRPSPKKEFTVRTAKITVNSEVSQRGLEWVGD